MALRFLADHCISNTIVQTIRDAAHEVVRLRDVARDVFRIIVNALNSCSTGFFFSAY